jgi:Cysteine rich repeat
MMQLFAITTPCLAIAMAVASLCTPAQAQSNAMVKACRGDAQSLCPSVKPGGGRLAQCLQQHEAELSAGCKTQMSTIQQCSQQVKQICGPEAATPAALRTCFAAHANEFSATCRSAVFSN